MAGPLLLVGLYGLILALHLVLPGRWVDGYVRDAAGARLRYRLNGLLVLGATVAVAAAAAGAGLVPWDVLYLHRWSLAATAAVVGIGFTLAIVVGAPARGSLAADLFLGRRDNPRLGGGRLDAKVFLYLVGAVMLELNVLSFTAHHLLAFPGHASAGVLLSAALLSFFVVDYLCFEEVHLYTYDFFAERVGFKLGWGCLAFYPFFYAVGLWSVVDRPDPGTPAPLLVGCALLFLAGWTLSRGANLQKFWFKIDPARRAFGLLEPAALEADGHRLLVGGFWGLARHVNYLGEIAMALGLTLALGQPGAPGPWLYPLYYVALLVPRQRDDDRRCAAKYGPLWDAYRRRVRWRIIPWVY